MGIGFFCVFLVLRTVSTFFELYSFILLFFLFFLFFGFLDIATLSLFITSFNWNTLVWFFLSLYVIYYVFGLYFNYLFIYLFGFLYCFAFFENFLEIYTPVPNVLLLNALNYIHPLFTGIYYTLVLFYLFYVPIIFFFRNYPNLVFCFFIFFIRQFLFFFFLGTVTLFLGMFWASQLETWGGWWVWDPSELLLLVVLVIGTTTIHTKLSIYRVPLFFFKVLFFLFVIYWGFVFIYSAAGLHTFTTRITLLPSNYFFYLTVSSFFLFFSSGVRIHKTQRVFFIFLIFFSYSLVLFFFSSTWFFLSTILYFRLIILEVIYTKKKHLYLHLIFLSSFSIVWFLTLKPFFFTDSPLDSMYMFTFSCLPFISNKREVAFMQDEFLYTHVSSLFVYFFHLRLNNFSFFFDLGTPFVFFCVLGIYLCG